MARGSVWIANEDTVVFLTAVAAAGTNVAIKRESKENTRKWVRKLSRWRT